MPEWKGVRFAELANPGRSSFSVGPFGSAITKENYVACGVPVVRGVNLSKGRFLDDEFAYITDEKADELANANLTAGDLVFTHRGTIGQVSIIPKHSRFARYVLSSSQVKARLDTSRTVPDFYYYWFRSPDGQHALLSHASTVGVPGIASPLATIKSIIVPLPPLKTQESISYILGALDDKIAVNDRIGQAADELRALNLRHWARSHSGSMEASPLSSFARFVNGRAFTKDATGTGRMVIRIAEINSGPGGSTVHNDLDVPNEHLARPGDVLFAWSGSLAVTRWYRPEAIINQHIFKVIPNAGVPVWMVYELVREKLSDFKAIAAGKATTMGHIQRHHLDEPVLAPKPENLNVLDAELGRLWDRALAAEQESLTLAELRDTLLPRLMSGEIRVRDAEQIVEDAT